MQIKDDESVRVAEEIYQNLSEEGVEVLLDDRDARPGVKFADAELIGIPIRITVGPKGLADGVIELVNRGTGDMNLIAIDEVVGIITDSFS